MVAGPISDPAVYSKFVAACNATIRILSSLIGYYRLRLPGSKKIPGGKPLHIGLAAAVRRLDRAFNESQAQPVAGQGERVGSDWPGSRHVTGPASGFHGTGFGVFYSFTALDRNEAVFLCCLGSRQDRRDLERLRHTRLLRDNRTRRPIHVFQFAALCGSHRLACRSRAIAVTYAA
jgi:hypothetical protein